MANRIIQDSKCEKEFTISYQKVVHCFYHMHDLIVLKATQLEIPYFQRTSHTYNHFSSAT